VSKWVSEKFATLLSTFFSYIAMKAPFRIGASLSSFLARKRLLAYYLITRVFARKPITYADKNEVLEALVLIDHMRSERQLVR